MTAISVKVPLRADLAGGTLDLWPLYLFHPGSRTVNVAISYHAECVVETMSDPGIDVHLEDTGYTRRYASLRELSGDPAVALLGRIFDHYHVSGVRITTRTDAPRGSGLGGSSALAVALVSAVSEFTGQPLEGEALIHMVRDLETRLIGSPAGVQDYYPPVFGGLASLHLEPGAIRRVPLSISIPELSEHFVLHYSDVSHFSGTNNWEIYKRQVEGDRKVREGLSAIAKTAESMEEALSRHDFAGAGALLGEEWRIRKSLIEGISTPEIDAAVEAGAGAGAWGAKVCGAGGGGCIVFLAPRDRRAEVVQALSRVPGRTLNAVPVAHGLEKVRPERSNPAPRRRFGSPQSPIDHLYAPAAGRAKYSPNVLVGASVSFIEPRAGLHLTQQVTMLAPITGDRVEWRRSARVQREMLELSAVPEARRGFNVSPDSEDLLAALASVEEGMIQQLEDSERFVIYHNPTFGVYSEPGEDRDSFIERCQQMAGTRLDDQKERLESTYRRRLDQMRERQQKEDRAREDDTEPETGGHDMNIAWGQTLYNITTGKTTEPTAPASPREGDYLERIALVQKQWTRELDTARDELNSQARQIEQIAVTPTAEQIHVDQKVLVWTTSAAPRVGARKRTPVDGSTH